MCLVLVIGVKVKVLSGNFKEVKRRYELFIFYDRLFLGFWKVYGDMVVLVYRVT